jgi:uncharacterized membrane protein YgcG
LATMRLLLLAISLLLLPVPALALCQCVCVQGVMRPICQQTDLMVPICQGICEASVRPERLTTPLAGGKIQFNPAETTNPSPGGLSTEEPNLNTNRYGQPLGTPDQLSGSVGSSLTSSGGSSSSSGGGSTSSSGR